MNRQTANAKLALIGYASGLGARDPGCADGPGRLKATGFEMRLRERGINASWIELLHADPRAAEAVATTVERLNERLAKTVGARLRAGETPMVLGGDHSSAVGTWRGAFGSLPASAKLGLLWIDAHMDSHTPETSHSGMLHGMPLATLLGYCGEGMPPCAAVLQPEHVCVVGARSHEPEEEALLSRLGVRVYRMDEINTRGVDAVLREAQARVIGDTAAYGISVDIDSIDPRDAPGVGTPASGGLRAQPLINALAAVTHRTMPLALEIAEFNPHADRADITLRLIESLAAALTGAEGAADAEQSKAL